MKLGGSLGNVPQNLKNHNVSPRAYAEILRIDKDLLPFADSKKKF
jgi:hypothetical protein